MDALAVARTVEAAKTPALRQRVLRAAVKTQNPFIEMAALALNPLTDFGLRAVARIEEDDGEPNRLTVPEFLQLTGTLASGRHPDPRRLVRDAAERCDYATWNGLYRRILLKDGFGLTPAEFDKALKAAKMPPGAMVTFPGPQMASKGKAPPGGRWLADMGLLGQRVLVLPRRAESPLLVDAKGVPVERPALRDALAPVSAALPGAVIFDAILVRRSLASLMDSEEGEECLAVLDLIPAGCFPDCPHPQDLRHDILQSMRGILSQHTGGLVWLLPKVDLDLDAPEGKQTLADLRSAAKAAGHPGVILKDPAAPYRPGKSRHWIELA